MHSAQLCSSPGLKREVKEPLKKMAGVILFTKEIRAAALKIVSSYSSGMNDTVYISIFTKAMTLKKCCLLSGFIQQLYFSSEGIFPLHYAGTKRGKVNKSNWK